MNSLFEIIYENSDFVVISKKNGFAVIKGRNGAYENNVFDLLKKNYSNIFIVHRIDVDTSGLVIFAKNSDVHRELSISFEKRNIIKEYLCVVWGKPKENEFIIDKPIKEYGSKRMGVCEDGKKSTTFFRFVKELNSHFSLVKALPYTGRRHQIRVHLFSCGNPIVGDKLYGDMSVQRKYPRMYLHSAYIKFTLFNKEYEFSDEKRFFNEIENISYIP